MKVADLLKSKWYEEEEMDEKEIAFAVANNKKRRLETTERADGVYVRATQGHSIPHIADEEVFDEIGMRDELPEHVAHGTFYKHLESIRTHGLWAGGGQDEWINHVHCCRLRSKRRRGRRGKRRSRWDKEERGNRHLDRHWSRYEDWGALLQHLKWRDCDERLRRVVGR